MDENRPPIPPIDFLLRSASERTSADVDPPPMASARSDEPSAIGWQSSSGQVEPCRDDPAAGPSVAVFYRDEAELRTGFLTALNAMGLGGEEPPRAGNASLPGRKP
jgi:hypothetical protein